jgi:hypothetical protein
MTGVEEPFGWSYVFGAVALTACLAGPLLLMGWWHSDLRQRRKAIAKCRRQLRFVEDRIDEFAEEMS